MRVVWGILLSLFLVAMPLFSQDEVFRKRGDSAQKATNLIPKAINQVEKTTNQTPKKPQKTRDSKGDSSIESKRDLAQESQKKPLQKETSAKKISPKKSPKTQNKSSEMTKLTNKKNRLGYRNITIQNIKKQKKIGVDFFAGVQFGIDIVSMQKIIEDENRNKITSDSISPSGSIGLKGGIVSEDEWVGGRFYAELGYTKYPKFDIVSVGVDLDLLVKYYEAVSWKIGGFLGLGGGMNLALIADKTLDSSGKKSLISVGWVNVGLVRFIYYHSTGNHGAELNAKIAYVTPTIYSLKDKTTNITTSYKGSSSTIMLSYVYQF